MFFMFSKFYRCLDTFFLSLCAAKTGGKLPLLAYGMQKVNTFHGMVGGKWSLYVYHTQKAFSKCSQKFVKMSLFFHSFVARPLADYFLPTTFWDMVRGKWALSPVWNAESELKFANIFMKSQQKSKIFYGVKTKACGCQFMKKQS